MSRIRKAVFPVAGLGTRFLPATKANPKEMLPVVDKPLIQYAVNEAVAAGIDTLVFITGRTKRAIADHFDRAPELEMELQERGKHDLLNTVYETVPSNVECVYIRQGEALGLGHAVYCARSVIGDEPFAVLLGDDLIDERNPLLPRMIEVAQERGGCVLALMEVPREQISLYGCAVVEETDDDDVVRVTGLVEKPPVDEAPSNLAVIGRYVLAPEIFEVLERTEPGRGGEIQLTDALAELAEPSAQGAGVHGVVFRGLRYDTGDRLDYIKAVIQLALAREDLGPELREWLVEYAAGLA
ncbi:MAG TPA: UTP--glucose-1-phosphate uridylyltransferase GalU [Brevibacterium sp.]|nr:UTP--glucose-1-phosphate uridylyltransferase GalU [Brevibacterium sp.]